MGLPVLWTKETKILFHNSFFNNFLEENLSEIRNLILKKTIKSASDQTKKRNYGPRMSTSDNNNTSGHEQTLSVSNNN